MKVQQLLTAAALCFVTATGVGCGDDSSDGDVPTDGGSSGTGGVGGTGGSGGTGGGDAGGMGGTGGGGTGGTGGGGPDPEEVAMCVEDSFEGVDDNCNKCMCECNIAASECGENCWKLASCVYQHCQISMPDGMTEQECTAALCGGYFNGGANAGTFTACWAPNRCGTSCGLWFTTPVAQSPFGGTEDAGTEEDAGN